MGGEEQSERIWRKLTPLERQVLQVKFGLIDGRHQTIEETAELLGLSQKSVRATEANALKKSERQLAMKAMAGKPHRYPAGQLVGLGNSDRHRGYPIGYEIGSDLVGIRVFQVRTIEGSIRPCLSLPVG